MQTAIIRSWKCLDQCQTNTPKNKNDPRDDELPFYNNKMLIHQENNSHKNIYDLQNI